MKRMWKIRMVASVVVAIIIKAAINMWLWNWLVPDLFHGPIINYYQSIGLIILARLLFLGRHGFRGYGMHYRGWRNWRGRWEKMDPEQREKMRELWKKRCGRFNCEDEKMGEEKI